MNLINLHIIILSILSFLLLGCGGPTGTDAVPRRATSPTAASQATKSSVKLTGEMNGNAVDINVALPNQGDVSLLDYNGSVTVTGQMKSSNAPCLSGFKPFNCRANISVGNINLRSCAVGKHTVNATIVLFRGSALKEGYSIKGIIIEPPFTCWYSQ